MLDKFRIPHFQTYIWLFIISACFTLALFGIAKKDAASNDDLAEAGARVTLIGCRATNTQAEVLASAIRGNLQSLELKFRNGETGIEAYRFSKRLLVQNLALVESTISDCEARVASLRNP